MNRLFFVVLFFISALAVVGEEIHLKDGTKISGQITAVTAEKFQIKTAYGDIQVPRTDIVSIEFPENRPKDVAPAKPSYDETLKDGNYKNATEKIQLTAPNNWVLAPAFLSTDVHGAIKSEDETAFVFITPEKFTGELSTYEVLVETQLQAKFKNFEKLSQADTKMDDRPAIRLVCHGIAPNGAPLKFLIYVISYKDRVVRLSFGTLDQLYDKSMPIFEKMAGSYKTLP